MLERLKSALRDTELPIETSKRCLTNRERRQGIELVHDAVQVELTKVGRWVCRHDDHADCWAIFFLTLHSLILSHPWFTLPVVQAGNDLFFRCGFDWN